MVAGSAGAAVAREQSVPGTACGSSANNPSGHGPHVMALRGCSVTTGPS
jgi:hypothetical protein